MAMISSWQKQERSFAICTLKAQIAKKHCSFLRILSHLLKKSLMENFIFCAVIWNSLKDYRDPAASAGFFSKCDQIRRKLWICSHLLKKFLMENFIFCAVTLNTSICLLDSDVYSEPCQTSKIVQTTIWYSYGV